MLAMASKVLYERELLALRQENNRLKIELFWSKHNANMVRDAMQCGNTFKPDSPNCRCVICVGIDRATRKKRLPGFDNAPCRFGSWFEAQLKRFGLTFVHDPCETAEREVRDRPELNELTGFVLDVDAHFVNIDGPEWAHFTFGKRLWGASNADDPELRKLSDLITYMQTVAR